MQIFRKPPISRNDLSSKSSGLRPDDEARERAHFFEGGPNLKLKIDGYTDSVGDAKHNLDLSKRRAEAVRSVLASQFGVDTLRLTSDGFGANNPTVSNDT